MRSLHLQKVLGAGSFGTVYLAELAGARGFSRQVAVKVLLNNHPDGALFLSRVRDEARLLGLLQDEHILKVLELTQVSGRDAVVMEYVEGVDLDQLVAAQQQPPARALAEIGVAVAGALQKAHTATHPSTGKPLAVIHRDVKPANIMLTVRGGVKLLDFGVASARFDARESKTGQFLLGTLNYIAPEYIITAEVSPKADVYGLGLTLWEAICGTAYGQPRIKQDQHEKRLRERLAEVPASHQALVPILQKMLAWNPLERPDAAAVERLLLAAADNLTGMSLRSWAGTSVPTVMTARPPTQDAIGLSGKTIPIADESADSTVSLPSPRGALPGARPHAEPGRQEKEEKGRHRLEDCRPSSCPSGRRLWHVPPPPPHRPPLPPERPMKLLTTRAFWRLATTSTVVFLSAATVAAYPDTSPIPQPLAASSATLLRPTVKYRTVRHTITDGETAKTALAAMGAPVDAVLRGAGSALDKIYAGDVLVLDYEPGNDQPFRVRFENDDPIVKALELDGEHYVLRSYPIPFTVEAGRTELTLTSSLWAAAEAAGLRPAQIMGLAKIFETEVDFNTELAVGATIRLVADKLTDENGNVRYGDIRGATLKNGKDSWTFIRFTGSDGQSGWYEPGGEGRKRPFLRSPLEFSRVTSGFSKGRFHPILKERRPHFGVDFGAPTGTLVRAVADGVVTEAGRHGGHGNYVELDHTGPYGTSYSHLSAILVRRGQKVKQGDLIGRVGSTGLSTGPHLHYQMTINGSFVDPTTVALPMTGGLSAPDLAEFRRVRDEIMGQLSGD